MVLPGIFTSGTHGHRVDVPGGHTRAQQSCRRDREHAGAGADVEHVECAPAFREIIKREKTAAGRPMMTGAEGEGSLDLDTDVVCPPAGAIMRAMNNEASRAHGLQSGKALRDPVVSGDALDAERIRRRFAGCEPDKLAQAGFVRNVAEMDRHLPMSGIILEGGAGGVRSIEAFAKKSGKTPCGRFVAGQTGDSGGRIHAAQDCPSHRARNGYVRPP